MLWAKAGDRASDGATTVRSRGKHYLFNMDDHIVKPEVFLGFSGAVFYILFTAGPHRGKLRVTNNLWHQGDIPDAYKEALPDNAVFLSKEEFLSLVLDQGQTGYTAKTIDPRPFAPPFTD